MNSIFKAILPALPDDPRFKISLLEQFILVLMKLRLNLRQRDLAYRFGISKESVGRYIEKFVNVMFVRLPDSLLLWPDREALIKTMPLSFKEEFPNCISIIDCFEVKSEIPGDLKDKASCYSRYKSSHTTKFLIGVWSPGFH